MTIVSPLSPVFVCIELERYVTAVTGILKHLLRYLFNIIIFSILSVYHY